MEFVIIAEMLSEGLDVYTPLIDDNGIDAVVRKPDGSFVEIQIKTRSKDINPGMRLCFQQSLTNIVRTIGLYSDQKESKILPESRQHGFYLPKNLSKKPFKINPAKISANVLCGSTENAVESPTQKSVTKNIE